MKAPFATPNGDREWMWVEISSWKDDKIKGLLENEPLNIPSLHEDKRLRSGRKMCSITFTSIRIRLGRGKYNGCPPRETERGKRDEACGPTH